MITGDLLKHRLFPDFEFMAGSAGLNREITGVSVIDAPDVDRWMRGGEFLIGSGYIFRDAPDDFIPFLRRANEKGTAAVGIKLDRYLHQLPSNLMEVADELKLPLFRIPLNYRWTDVIEIVHNYLALEKQHTQNPSSDTTGNFWGEGFDIKELLSGFAQQLQRPLFISSEQLNLHHCFAPNGKVEDSETNNFFPKVPVLEEKALPLHGQIIGSLELRNTEPPVWNAVYAITADTPITVRMRLAPGEQTPSARQERLVLRAMTMLRTEALEIAVQSSKQLAKRERFFEGLCLDVYSDLEMIKANLKDMGVKIPQISRIVMISPIDESAALVWQEPYTPLSYKLGNIWVGLVPSVDMESSQYAEYESLAREAGYFVAFGGLINSPLGIGRSYREARQTLNWARNFSLHAGVYQYDELSLYALLDSLIRLPEATGVWKRYWEPIINMSQKKKSVSMQDLAVVLIEADFNAKLCSEWLHLHYNTVRNYIEELQQLLGVNLNMPHHQLGLTLGYYIEKSRKRNEINLLTAPGTLP
jgi:purine catabolism regulator